MSQPSHITLSGAPEGFDAGLLARELARGVAVIHVARDDKRMEAMRAALAFMAPGVPVLTFPAWDCLPYDRISPNPDLSAERMATLAALAQGMAKPVILLTTLNAATQRVPRPEVVRGTVFRASVGGRLDEAGLRGWLARMGFSQTSTVSEPGDFAVRGGIIDIFPPGPGGPVRLDLFGDVLDGARRFDPVTQRTTEKLKLVEFAPASEVLLDEASVMRFRQAYRIEFGAAGTDDPLYEAVSAGRKHAGMEHWLPFFHDGMAALFDYLPDATVMLDDQVTAARLARWEGIADQYDARSEAMRRKDRVSTVYKPCPPGLLYLDDAAWGAGLAARRVVQLVALPQPTGPGVLDAGGRIGRNFAPERQIESISLFRTLADHLEKQRQAGQVVVASYSEGARERLKGLLEDEDVLGLKTVRDLRDVGDWRKGERGDLHLAVWALEHGFEADGLTVVSEQDVLGDRLIRAPKKRRKAENFLREADSLSARRPDRACRTWRRTLQGAGDDHGTWRAA